jgi:hypothetical protein
MLARYRSYSLEKRSAMRRPYLFDILESQSSQVLTVLTGEGMLGRDGSGCGVVLRFMPVITARSSPPDSDLACAGEGSSRCLSQDSREQQYRRFHAYASNILLALGNSLPEIPSTLVRQRLKKSWGSPLVVARMLESKTDDPIFSDQIEKEFS